MNNVTSSRDRAVGVLNSKISRAFDDQDFDPAELRDEELVRLYVSKQNEGAFNELVNRYWDKVYRLSYRITGNADDAEEVLQEVFIILMEKLGTFREEARFSTWLYRVASNASFMYLRNGRKINDKELSLDDYKPYNDYGALEGVAEKDWSDSPDSALLNREGTEIIEKAISELPEDYRIVFHLKDVEGLTSKEISKILGLTLPAVKSRVLRARLFLRDKLSDYYFDRAEG
ncbi:MAG: sigma-70 family RNA polymerase sigma factor [Deltaproteobacteria bacterium]